MCFMFFGGGVAAFVFVLHVFELLTLLFPPARADGGVEVGSTFKFFEMFSISIKK